MDMRERAMGDADFTTQARGLAASPETAAVAREHLAFCFRCTLQHLSEHQAGALLLKEVHGMSNGEVAAVLELSEIQVKHRRQEARRRLRELYADRCALAEQQGVCHQCVELDSFFEANAGDPLRGTDGSLRHRLRVIRDDEGRAPGPWTTMLGTMLETL